MEDLFGPQNPDDMFGPQQPDSPLDAAMKEAERQANEAEKRRRSGYQYPGQPDQETTQNSGQTPEFTRHGTKRDISNQRPGSTSELATPEDQSDSTITKPAGTGLRARDGQTLAQQSGWTRSAFQSQYGAEAEREWIKQHEAELDKNRQAYGVDEPLAGANPLPTAPAGTKAAPSRTIGAVAPPPAAGQAPITAAPASGTGWSFQPGPQASAPTNGVPSYTATDLVVVQDLVTKTEITMTGAQLDAAKANPALKDRYQPLRIVAPGSATTIKPPTAPLTAPSALAGGQAAQGAGAAPVPGSSAPSSASAPQPVTPGVEKDEDVLTVSQPSIGGAPFQITRAEYKRRVQFSSTTGPSTLKVDYDPAHSAPQTPANPVATQTMSLSTGTQATAAPNQTTQSYTSDVKPVDEIVRMAGKSPEEARRVTQGISALLKGDPSGAYAEPYLNDVARMAWAKQERAQGRNVDPLDAPTTYIESWKDAFYGSDVNVPLVRELDQQMIDYAADQSTAVNRPFDWKEAFGDTGENGLISRQVASNDCGPNAFSTVLRSFGYNADPAQTFEYAKQKGYHDGEQFTGPNNMARMLREEAGIQAQAVPMDWSLVDKELDAGRVVVLSSGGHYWTVSARRDGPNGPEYYGGATSTVVGNAAWSPAAGIRHGGAPNTMIITQGTVDPNSRAVREMGLKPPTGSGATPNRALLSSMTTNGAQRLTQNVTQNMRNSSATNDPEDPNGYADMGWKIAEEEQVDPILVASVMNQESNKKANAQSGAGAYGLMQLMPDTARAMGVEDITDPQQNIRGGVRYLKQMLQRYNGNVELALAAYNAGPGAVDKYGGIPPYGETQAYVPAVLARYKYMQDRYAGVAK
jgi:hypothetical protein